VMCAVRVHSNTRVKVPPEEGSIPSEAIRQGHRVTDGLEARRQRPRKEVERVRRPQRE
jgi:hypothetical protein